MIELWVSQKYVCMEKLIEEQLFLLMQASFAFTVRIYLVLDSASYLSFPSAATITQRTSSIYKVSKIVSSQGPIKYLDPTAVRSGWHHV